MKTAAHQKETQCISILDMQNHSQKGKGKVLTPQKKSRQRQGQAIYKMIYKSPDSDDRCSTFPIIREMQIITTNEISLHPF